MVEYSFDPGKNLLDIMLPKEMVFGQDFLIDMSELLKRALDKEVHIIRINCKKNPRYPKMCKAYIYIVVIHLNKKKNGKCFWHTTLFALITPSVRQKAGASFAKVDFAEAANTPKLNFYRFKSNEEAKEPVVEMTNLIVKTSITIGESDVREFLSTTIGEIFANSNQHSDQDEVFFMYDIDIKDGFYLSINIIDYGKTIIDNVKNYLRDKNSINVDSKEAMLWAIKSGNTTKKGSGGYGLAMLIQYIDQCCGELSIFSGDAYYYNNRNDNKEEAANYVKGYFPGTSVTFKVQLYNTSTAITVDSSKKRISSIRLDSL